MECKRCVLSTKDDPSIELNQSGVCNYCSSFETQWKNRGSKEQRANELQLLINQIKQEKGKYNCLLGLSGGVDSSYLAYWASKKELRPLVVHFDNGWNSELAVKNIHSICEKLNYDLQTIVIEWQEFKQLQLAYLKAGVVDIEVLTDHAIYATITQLAKKNGIKHIVSGYNLATEGIMPKGWVYDKRDWSNIRDIALQYGGIRSFKTFPHVTFFKGLLNHFFHKIEIVQPLNLLDYNKQEAKALLIRELGWRDYGGKHYESIFTKFYQAYILPKKFGIDKRKAHLSTLIGSGQITKEEALSELQEPLYESNELAEDIEYILKKFQISEAAFNAMMEEDPRAHKEFKTDKALWNKYFKLVNLVKLK